MRNKYSRLPGKVFHSQELKKKKMPRMERKISILRDFIQEKEKLCHSFRTIFSDALVFASFLLLPTPKKKWLSFTDILKEIPIFTSLLLIFLSYVTFFYDPDLNSKKAAEPYSTRPLKKKRHSGTNSEAFSRRWQRCVEDFITLKGKGLKSMYIWGIFKVFSIQNSLSFSVFFQAKWNGH